MNKLTFCILFILGFATIGSSQNSVTAVDTNYIAKHFIPSGMYHAIADKTEKDGFKYIDDSYFLVITDPVSLVNIDTVYLEKVNGYDVLTFKFNETGKKILSNFTTRYKGQKIALLIGNKIISMPTIIDSIDAGIMTLNGVFTLAELRDLKMKIEAEVKKLKERMEN